MEEFELPVTYKGKDLMFTTTLEVFGYTYRLVVDVNGQSVNFERDEERKFRAILNYEDVVNAQHIDPDLLQAIGDSIERIS